VPVEDAAVDHYVERRLVHRARLDD